MNQTSRIALNLGLAALVGLAAGPARADGTVDLEAEIRAFETEKRAELDEALTDVAAVLDEQRQELELIQATIARSEAALARLEAMKRALDSIDATAMSAAPVPVGYAMPPLPTRSTPDSVALTANQTAPAEESHCCAAEAGSPAPAGWKPGAAATNGSGVRVLTLPDGTLRVVPETWAEGPEPPSAPRLVRGVSATGPATDPIPPPIADAAPPAVDEYAQLVDILRGLLARLETMEGTEGLLAPPGVVYPSPSSIVPTP